MLLTTKGSGLPITRTDSANQNVAFYSAREARKLAGHALPTSQSIQSERLVGRGGGGGEGKGGKKQKKNAPQRKHAPTVTAKKKEKTKRIIIIIIIIIIKRGGGGGGIGINQ